MIPDQTLTYINIYFDTATMEEITYSMRINFETKLSTIGGTMGLFTGFSLLSAIEIVYHSFKIILRLMKKRMLKKKMIQRRSEVNILNPNIP